RYPLSFPTRRSSDLDGLNSCQVLFIHGGLYPSGNSSGPDVNRTKNLCLHYLDQLLFHQFQRSKKTDYYTKPTLFNRKQTFKDHKTLTLYHREHQWYTLASHQAHTINM